MHEVNLIYTELLHYNKIYKYKNIIFKILNNKTIKINLIKDVQVYF